MKKIRILLLEDNRVLREGITVMLNRRTDFRVLTATGSKHDILRQAERLKPHVILIDLGLGSQNGLHIVTSLTTKLPQIRVIGMGLIPTQEDVLEFVKAGASGFLLKDATLSDFLRTIRSVARGAKVLPPLMTDSLFSHVIDHAFRNGKGHLAGAVRMTKREREIIALIAEGLPNKEIAGRLSIATYTVKSHVHNILEKLALHTRLEIAVYTRKNATG